MNKQIKKSHCNFDPPCNYDPETYDGYVICMSCNDHIDDTQPENHIEGCSLRSKAYLYKENIYDCGCPEGWFDGQGSHTDSDCICEEG